MPRNINNKEKEINEKSVSRARAISSKERREGMELGETSFRVYYGETGAAVPFTWESQPGTPKHPIFNKSNDNIVPPLTPPPSYNSSSTSSSRSTRLTRRPRILLAFLSSISRRNTHSHVVTPTPTLSSSSYSGPLSWSTSSSNSSSLSVSSPRRRIKDKSQRMSLLMCSISRVKKFPLFDDDTEEDMSDSPRNSTIMCFGFKKQGCYSMKGIKNVLLTTKGH